MPLVAPGTLVPGIGALPVFAGPVPAFLSDTSAQIFGRQSYISAVMETPRAIEAESLPHEGTKK